MIKIVLTGGPASGKTTIVNMLKKKGFYIVPEVATIIFEKIKSKWKVFDREKFQDLVLKYQLIYESKIPKTEKVAILDRGTIDGLAYDPTLFKRNGLSYELELKKI